MNMEFVWTVWREVRYRISDFWTTRFIRKDHADLPAKHIYPA